MKAQSLYDNLSKMGLPFLRPSEEVDVNSTLAEVVKSNDMRLWEGFPVLLQNAANSSGFSMDEVGDELSQEQREFFHALLLLSLSVYALKGHESTWSRKVMAGLPNDDREAVRHLRKCLVRGQTVNLSGNEFSPSRLLKTFDLYLVESDKAAKKKSERHVQLSLEYALSQLFSPKQKELLKKKLDGQPMSKTEREYYSRTVKKKVVALANSELHSLARKLLEQS